MNANFRRFGPVTLRRRTCSVPAMKAASRISPPEIDARGLASLHSALDRDGFIVVPAALDEAWVARLRRAFESAPVQASGTQRVADFHGRNPLPGFGQQGLHTDDVPRAPGAPYVVFTTLWMLDDFTAE